MLILNLTSEQNLRVNRKIHDFVSRLSYTYYGEKRNATVDKAESDHFLGKKAEVQVALYLAKQMGYPTIRLDFDIREGNTKGWFPDLPYRSVDPLLPDIHVKACNDWSRKVIGEHSWTFQSGEGGTDVLFTEERSADLIALVHIPIPYGCEAHLCGLYPWGVIRPLLRDPVKSQFVGVKKCLYETDLGRIAQFNVCNQSGDKIENQK